VLNNKIFSVAKNRNSVRRFKHIHNVTSKGMIQRMSPSVMELGSLVGTGPSTRNYQNCPTQEHFHH
jgi:hypothetical protein